MQSALRQTTLHAREFSRRRLSQWELLRMREAKSFEKAALEKRKAPNARAVKPVDGFATERVREKHERAKAREREPTGDTPPGKQPATAKQRAARHPTEVRPALRF